MCADLLRLLVSLVVAGLMVIGLTHLLGVDLEQAHALLYAALVLGLYALLGALRYSWRLNRFLRLNELSEAESRSTPKRSGHDKRVAPLNRSCD